MLFCSLSHFVRSKVGISTRKRDTDECITQFFFSHHQVNRKPFFRQRITDHVSYNSLKELIKTFKSWNKPVIHFFICGWEIGVHLFHLSWDSYRKYSRSACDSWKIIHMLFQKLSHLVLCGLEGCFLIKNGPRKQFGQHLVFAWSYYWTPNKTSTCAALAALGTIKNSISTLWSTVITELMRKRQRPKMADRESNPSSPPTDI